MVWGVGRGEKEWDGDCMPMDLWWGCGGVVVWVWWGCGVVVVVL